MRLVRGRVELLDEAARQLLGVDPGIEIGDDARELLEVYGGPVAQVAAPCYGGIALEVVAYEQLSVGLEVARDDARAAEGVEYPEPVPAETPLDLLDRAADLTEERPLVADIRNKLARQVLRVLGAGGSRVVLFDHRRSAGV